MKDVIASEKQLSRTLKNAFENAKIIDMHTHLFPPSYGELCLYGIDELLTYHYLIAEAMRQTNIPYEKFWALSKKEQAGLVWDTLFLNSSPISEATMGVITILEALGIDYAGRDLEGIRRQFDEMTGRDRLGKYVDRLMEISHVEKLVMTNDPFHPVEREYMAKQTEDPRFLSSLRLDAIFGVRRDDTFEQLKAWGYGVERELDDKTVKELQRFLSEWIERMNPVYLAVSFPPSYRFPDESPDNVLLRELVLPLCREHDLPLAIMLGAKRGVNPDLKLAGDAVGLSSVESLMNLFAAYPDNRFLVTGLSRENQYELIVAARKFRNMMLFGCWWFLNTPHLVEEITRMRVELLGTSFIVQHSDCRVFEQLIYKWQHSIELIEKILFDKYRNLLEKGWLLKAQDVERDVNKLLRENFVQFSKLK